MTSHLLTKKLISISANHPIVLILARVYPSATNPQQLFLVVIFLNSKLLITFFLGGRVGTYMITTTFQSNRSSRLFTTWQIIIYFTLAFGLYKYGHGKQPLAQR